MKYTELHKLANFHTEHQTVSIYFPTVKAGSQVDQNPIRFKNLLREAGTKLTEAGVAKEDLEVIKDLEGLIADQEFWRTQSEGIAIFAAPGFIETHKLPVSPPEIINVNHRFHIKPLLRLFNNQERYFVLALSKNQVRIYKGTEFEISELTLPKDMPQSLAESEKFKVHEEQIQHRTIGNGMGSIFHGHGEGEDSIEAGVSEFLNKVAVALQDKYKLANETIVLATTPELAAMFRKLSEYHEIVESEIAGNPEHLSADELHKKAVEMTKPIFEQRLERIRNEFGNNVGQGLASSDLSDVLTAARQGRVRWALISESDNVWGAFSESDNSLRTEGSNAPGLEDLLDRVAIEVMQSGGTVFLVDQAEIPNQEQVAAVYRY